MTQLSPAQLAAANMQFRRAILPGIGSRTIDSIQQIYSQTFTNYVAGQQMVLNVVPQNFGLLKRFYIRVTATLVQGAAETQTRVSDGPANFFSNITYLDTSNQPRCNAPGWYVHLIASARRKWISGSALTTDTPTGLGSIFPVIKAPTSFTTSDSTFAMFYEVPIAYNDFDLRGAVNASVYNATQSLQLTVNPNFFVAAGADAGYAAYQSSTAQLGKITSFTVTVYQNCIDQIGGLQLPFDDLSWQYCLATTNGGNPVVNADQIIPYANFRQFYSTLFRYDNAGVLNAGTDIARISIRTANGTNIMYIDPILCAYLTRAEIGDDMPAGTYYLSHRNKPVMTDTFGNMSLVVNASAVTGITSILTVGYEYFQQMSLNGASQPLTSAT